MQAIKSGSLEKVRNLYDRKFHEIKNSPMHYACKLSNADIVKFLLKNNFKIDVIDSEYYMPIHYASINNSVKILDAFIQHKCSLEARDMYGMKPIHLACLNGNFQNVKLLIENRCDLEARDYLERRPIHLACLAGNIEIVKLLIQNKCKIDDLDKSNDFPFSSSERECHRDIVDFINEEISRRMIENMIIELRLKCIVFCDHKFCPISLRNKTFNKGVKIKKGGTSKVYQCKLSQDSRQIAIKKIPKNEIDSENIEGNINKYINEINHERIIKYFGAITKEDNIFIFMEFMSAGSLRSQISTNQPMTYNKVIHYTIQILEGLHFLHSKKIIHRDIKPDNVLLDNDGNVKLTDFGLGLSLRASDGHTTQAKTYCGTPHYMALEVINGEEYSYGADIWSLGVTVIEMATGKCPYQGLSDQRFAMKLVETKTIQYQLPSSSPSDMKSLIDQMLLPEPSRRPSAMDLINKFKTLA